jgi:hypothetical protein
MALPLAQTVFSQPNSGDFRKFLESVKDRFSKTGLPNRHGSLTPVLKFDDICRIETDYISKTVFAAYGAAFVAAESVRTPGACIYDDENAVRSFQNSTKYTSTVIGGATIELQETAMNALLRAITQADAEGLSITPLDGSVAARRSYADTVRIWNSRFLRALAHWTSKGRIRPADAELVKKMAVKDQVKQVLEWEKQGMYFSTDMSKSILYATAPPGTSQHISMLAFDVVNYGNKRIREILGENGWFQTIVTDTPHFTYLGRKESELSEFGLRKVKRNGYTFWVPPPLIGESVPPAVAGG